MRSPPSESKGITHDRQLGNVSQIDQRFHVSSTTFSQSAKASYEIRIMSFQVGQEVMLADGTRGTVVGLVTRAPRRPIRHATVQFENYSAATYAFDELQVVEASEVSASKTVKVKSNTK
jgi:hypothetical protein